MAGVVLGGKKFVPTAPPSEQIYQTLVIPAEGRVVRIPLGAYDSVISCPGQGFPPRCISLDMSEPTVCWKEGMKFRLYSGTDKLLRMDWTDWLSEFANDAPIIAADVEYAGQVSAVLVGVSAYTMDVRLTAPAQAVQGMCTEVTWKITTEGQTEKRPFTVVVC